MPLGQRLIPIGVNTDISPLYIPTDKAFFLKGLETGWTINGGKGANAAELKPSESNFLFCSVTLPEGVNTTIGYYYFSEGNEGYVIVHNSLGYHFIYRLKGANSQCEIVYRFCKDFTGITNKPKDYFSEGRIAMKSLLRYLPNGEKELYKELYLVNKKVDNLRIVIEDSVATNSFTTPFFTSKNSCCGDACRIIKSGVPTPMGEIKISPISPTPSDKLKQNLMLFKMFQFRFIDENAWGQRSEYGLVSQQYYNNLAGCSRDAASQPHCVNLETNMPCPEIVKRTVVVRSCELRGNVGGTSGNDFSEWKEAFTIDLYNQEDPNLKWYERQYDVASSDFEMIDDGKKMRIKFCNNRECKPIAIGNIRNSNPAPFNSGSVASIGKELLYADNENDLDRFSKEDISKVSYELIPTASCEMKYARIKVYAVVHNHFDDQNQPLHKREGYTAFGGFGQDPSIGNTRFEEGVGKAEGAINQKAGAGQVFPTGKNGFTGRLAGTSYTAESVQYKWAPSGITEVGVYDVELDEMKKLVSDVGWGRDFWIQEFDFGLVPLGTYQFRIQAHNPLPGIDPEKTSTFYSRNTHLSLYGDHWDFYRDNRSEIFIDTTNGEDWDGLKQDIAMIHDLTDPANFTSKSSRAVHGYLYESRKSKIPVEMAEVRPDYNFSTGFWSEFTDHNGFFYMSLRGGQEYKVQIFGSSKCSFNIMLAQTGEKSAEGTSNIGVFYAADRVATYSEDLCNRYIISGAVRECGNGANQGGGIEGIAVVMSRTNPVYTNSKGEFRVVAHYSNGRGLDKVIFSLGGGCYILDCKCDPIKVVINVNQPPCTSCNENNTSIGAFSLQSIVTYGNPHGSRQQIGMKGVEWLGRETAIQTADHLFVDFPSEQEQGNATFPRLKVKLPYSFSPEFCRKYKYLTFSLSKNINFEDWIEWAADKVEFVDSAGNENTTNPSKIRIWYRSLNEYNKLRGLNTNTSWTIMDNDGNTKVGDIVEFIKNVEGEYFPPNTVGNVQHDKQGTYFLVDFDDSLRNLKDGVKFKLKRPYACETQKTFYEYGFPINFCGQDCRPRNDQGEVITEFYLNMFSAYMLPRQLPVVTDVTTVADGIETVTEKKEIKVYPFTYEHHSPSDTWGDHCHNGGRVSYVNPYEKKRSDRNQILRTGALNQQNDGSINYLHYFSLSDEYVVDEQGWGGIVAMLVRDDAQVLLVCEFTTFSFRTNDDRAIVDENGYVRLPIKAIFGKPERNPTFNFGCQPNDINTIHRIDSLVTFLDSNKQAFVLHDFNSAKDYSPGVQSWLVPSIKHVIANADKFYWHSCFDTRQKKIWLTKFNLETRKYLNKETEQNISLNETMEFSYETMQWAKWGHVTAEFYGNMSSDTNEKQFFSFKNGIAYAHYNAVTPSKVYLNYFGEQCFPVIGVVTNIGGTEEKLFTANEVYCREVNFILKEVETSMGQHSRVLKKQWERGGGISYAPYLCDMSNPDKCNPAIKNQLFDGDSLYGKWLKGLYIPDPTEGYDGRFFLLSSIISYFVGRAKGTGG